MPRRQSDRKSGNRRLGYTGNGSSHKKDFNLSEEPHSTDVFVSCIDLMRLFRMKDHNIAATIAIVSNDNVDS